VCREILGVPAEVLRAMQDALERAEPGRRHFDLDEIGKVISVIPQRSTYPQWMPELGVEKTRQNIDRLLKVINLLLVGDTGPDKRTKHLMRNVWRWVQIRGIPLYYDDKGIL